MMNMDDQQVPLNQAVNFDDDDDEVDPNLYGEETLNFEHEDRQANNDTSSHRPSCPVAPLPQIKSEPEETIIRREPSPYDLFANDTTLMTVEEEPQNNSADSVANSSQNPEPSKRQRLIPEVLVYTWKDLQKEREKDFEKIKKMSNPKVKKPKDLSLSLSTLHDRLNIAGLIPVKIPEDREIWDQAVSRAFMSSVYGGGAQDTFPKIGRAKYAEHGMKNFMYVNLSLHVHAAQMPGDPGLFLDSEINSESLGKHGDVFKTFARVDAGKWMYVGDYVLVNLEPFSKDEWNLMEEKARNAWVSFLMKKAWAGGLRARIIARRELGRRATTPEYNRVWEERSNDITPPEIHAALSGGHEQLGLYRMQCVSYDEAFQIELVEKFRRWIPPAPKPKGVKKGRRGENNLKLESDSESKPKIEEEIKIEPETKPTLQKSRKRKRRTTPESDAALSPESEDSGVDNGLLQDKPFKKKLRRKRVVPKEEDLNHAVLSLVSDDGNPEDGDWRPENDVVNKDGQRPPPSRVSGQLRLSGARDDPIIL